MSASIYSKSGDIIFTNAGRIAPGAKLYFYDAETTTPRDTYSDSNLTAERTHPVLADGNGRVPVIYLDYGAYDVKVTTSGGTQLFYHTNLANPAPFDDETTFDTTTFLATGDIFSSLVNGTRTGAVRLNGRTIGNASSGGTERANADTSNLYAYLWNNLANGQAAVSSGRGASAAQDFAANKTITLPDWRAAGPVGFDDMGAASASQLILAPVVTGAPTTPGSILGLTIHVLTEAQTPAHTHSFSATSGTESADHTHSISITTSSDGGHTPAGTNASSALSSGVTAAISRFNTGAGGGANEFLTTIATGLTTTYAVTGTANAQTFTGTAVSAHTHSVSGTSGGKSATHTHSVSGTSGSTGSGTAHNNLSRSGLVTWHIKL